MQAAAASREELADRIVGVERLEQLDLALARLEQRRADALLLNRRTLREMQGERGAPDFQPGVEIRHDDADVMNLLEHRCRASCSRDRDTASAATCPTGPSCRRSQASDARRGSAPACCRRPGYCPASRKSQPAGTLLRTREDRTRPPDSRPRAIARLRPSSRSWLAPDEPALRSHRVTPGRP